jgi:hypothetical protein
MSCGSCIQLPFNKIEPGWEDVECPCGTVQNVGENQPITQIADMFQEWINFNIVPNQLNQYIPFQVVKATPTVVDKGLRVYNTVDTTQIIVSFNIVSSTQNGMTLLLSSAVDTTNYFIKGLVQAIS